MNPANVDKLAFCVVVNTHAHPTATIVIINIITTTIKTAIIA